MFQIISHASPMFKMLPQHLAQGSMLYNYSPDITIVQHTYPSNSLIIV